jgi:hypothetical protein
MAQLKWGFDQANSPAPLGFRRFTNATILCFIPMVTGIIQGIPLGDGSRNYWMIGLTAIPVLLKGIGMVLGNGQEFVPSNEEMDKK